MRKIANKVLCLLAIGMAGCATSAKYTLVVPEKKVSESISERPLYIKSGETRPCEDCYYFLLANGRFHKTKIPIQCGDEF